MGARFSPRARGHPDPAPRGDRRLGRPGQRYFWIDRTTGVAGALLTQVLPFFDAPIVDTYVEFEQAVYALVGASAAT